MVQYSVYFYALYIEIKKICVIKKIYHVADRFTFKDNKLQIGAWRKKYTRALSVSNTLC